MPRTKAPLGDAQGWAVLLSAVFLFASLAKGAHDLWAATIVYLAVLGLAAALLLRVGWKRGAPGMMTAFIRPLAGIILVFTLSFIQAVNPGESFLSWMDWLAAMALFLVALHVFQSERAVDIFLAGIVLILGTQLGATLYQRRFIAELRLVPCGTLVNANIGTAFAIAWVAPLLERVLRSARAGERSRWFWAAGLAVNLLLLLSLSSTWGAVCLLTCLPLAIGPRRLGEWARRRPHKARGAAAMIVMAVAALVLWKFTRVRLLGGGIMAAGVKTQRFGWWGAGIRMLLDKPWLGVGLGNFPSAYLSYRTGTIQNTLYAHSFAVGLLAETGFLGFFSFLGFLVWWLYRLIRESPDVAVRWSFLVGLAMLLMYTCISLGMEYLINLMALWLIFGIAAAPVARSFWKPRKSMVLAALAVACAAVSFILAPLRASQNCIWAGRLLEEGKIDDALEAFHFAARLDSRSFAARRGLARAHYARYLSGRAPRDLEEAVRHQQKAAQLNRLRGLMWWELGKYQQAAAKNKSALLSFERAAALHFGSKGFLKARNTLRGGVPYP